MVTASSVHSPTGHAPERLKSLTKLAGSVPDPELPVVTLAELGVLRRVSEPSPGHVEVELTPTYTGCPAIEAMAADIEQALREGGAERVTVRTVLTPLWSTDDISPEGRRKLAAHGVAPPRPGARASAPVTVGLSPTRHATPEPEPETGPEPDPETAPGTEAGTGAGAGTGTAPEPVRCPLCGSADTVLLARFSSTACKALRRCEACREPFDHFKEV
ncbi:1,2-phenylacetyl-CoA epoxidase subunit PaaD [Streptomyces iconiensis]|uniref:Phenylacetate-CoA oxygenase subunit PaaJ n=1 Tax=Streptomyces iconiensis TaxID=1384038 RepID=A0ABT6ZSJ4_9ACTN|nr:1,2-phenylacetyl-CoA epoxidase subunit PaaD [Streptomyces iconiensis]MDJ1131606.1 phenylacetate-CoA oxygenase subunit PaaJ [Streptomyces iconiensis]